MKYKILYTDKGIIISVVEGEIISNITQSTIQQRNLQILEVDMLPDDFSLLSYHIDTNSGTLVHSDNDHSNDQTNDENNFGGNQ